MKKPSSLENKIIEMQSRHEKIWEGLKNKTFKEDLRHKTDPTYAKLFDKMVTLAKKRAS